MIKIYFEDEKSSMGGYEKVGYLKLVWWLLLGRINPKPNEKTTRYYIRKLETIKGKRI